MRFSRPPFKFILALTLVGAAAACAPAATDPTIPPALIATQRGGGSVSITTETAESTIQAIGPVTGPLVTQAAQSFPSPTPTTTASASPVGADGSIFPTFGAVVGPEYTPPPTLTPLPPPITVTALTPAPPTGAGPTPTFPFGPVVGPDYTPPPTITPNPTPDFLRDGTLPPPVTPGPSPTPGPILRADLMGVQIHGFLTDSEFSVMLDRVAELGVKWVKIQIDWSLFEPTRGQFNDFYRGAVLNIQRASIRGFRTLLSIAKAPDWARPASVRGVESGPPDNPQDLATFVARLVREVKPEFIDAIEIWNEANLIREWRGKPINGETYMAYFRAAYDAILEEQRAQPSALKPDHRITVITAGPAPTVTFTGMTMGDREWLQQLYDNGLASIGPDVVVGVHPYGWANPPEARCCAAAAGVTGWYEHPSFYFRETLEAYRKIMISNNHASAKLWVTEFGWATYDGLRRSDGRPALAHPNVGWQNLINQNQQADYVLRAFKIAQQPPYYDFLGPMVLWNLNYSLLHKSIDNGSDAAGFSLLDGGGNPRPVFVALQNAAKQ